MSQQHGNILLCCIYRPPNAAPIINDHIVDTLEKAISEDKKVILIGDLNYAYLQTESHMYFRKPFFNETANM